jgi:ABC-type uncharacterized transport system substrate-binding protein
LDHEILAGTKPMDVPVEVDNQIELRVNVQVARTLVLTVSPQLVYRADRVIR